MIKFISSVLVVLMLAGNGVDYKQERGDTANLPSQQGDADNNAKLYVSVEFSLSIQDLQEHPFLVNSFNAAVAEWATHLPIRTTFYFEGVLPIIGTSIYRNNAIRIGFVDLQSSGYQFDDAIIGIWLPSQSSVLFDLDYFQKNPGKLYSVALHELGHVFGLPHIINKHDLGSTGYLVLQEGDATDLVMYPVSFLEKPQNELSDVEIDFASHQVMFIFSLNQLSRQTECKIAVDKL